VLYYFFDCVVAVLSESFDVAHEEGVAIVWYVEPINVAYARERT
jgi:hypothetical protein